MARQRRPPSTVLNLDALQSIPADRASVERYLEETGLTPAAVLAALNLAKTPDFPHARERLTEEELETGGRLGTELIALERWAWLAGRLKHPDAPERPEHLSEGEGAAVLQALATLPALPFGAVPVRGTLGGLAPTQRPIYRALEDARRETVETLLAHAPTYRDALAERQALDAKARLSPAELHERITAYLTRPDGTVAPSPAEWCAVTGQDLAALEQALYAAHVATLQAERDRLAGELKRERTRKRRGLPSRTVLPQRLIDAGYRDVGANVALDVDAGILDLFGDFTERERTFSVLRSEAVKAPQLATLETPEVRTLLGVYRLATDADDNGRLRDRFTVPAALMWHAMGLTGAVRDNERRTHFGALMALKQKRIRWTATVETDHGAAVIAGECAPFEMRPVWSKKADDRRTYAPEEADAIAEQWHALKDGEAWAGPLPDHFAITIPDDMRVIDRRLVLSGDVLAKLDAGAKVGRGARESFSTLDWSLWVEITQTVQRPHKGRAFVDVDAVLAKVYGAERVATQRRKGKLRGPTGYLTQYEKAVRVLEAGGMARRVLQDHATVKGRRRDVFEILEGNVLTKAQQSAPTLPGIENEK